MSDTIIVGLIGAAATIVAAFKDEIRLIIKGTSASEPYAGEWDAVWMYSGAASPVKDVVTLKTSGAALNGSGTGAPTYGGYALAGEANPHNVTLTYSGQDRSKELSGTVIAKKTSPDRIEGVWCQYLSDGTFRNGTTAWTRRR